MQWDGRSVGQESMPCICEHTGKEQMEHSIKLIIFYESTEWNPNFTVGNPLEGFGSESSLLILKFLVLDLQAVT